ncbi:phage integrase SAM-like domain-containing protein [Lutibacter aestuarii]|uniref:Phage integrase SAM-like domain-containing protein n=1 Tax=Lutibacter aestuarii TaxID=861111 RepID=A0ABW2Z9I5_9FLAO
MVAKIILYTNKKNKNGYPVVFYFSYKKIRKRIALGWYFFKHQWNFEKEEPFPDAPNFNFVYPQLLNYNHKIKHLIFKSETNLSVYLALFNKDKNVELLDLKKRMNELLNESNVGVLEFFDVIIDEKIKKGESTRFYIKTKDQFKQFLSEDTPLNLIDYTWMHNFILYKKKQGTGDSGIMAYLRTLRAVYKEAQRRPLLNIKNENPFLGIIKTIDSNKIIEFTTDDFIKLLHFKPHKFTPKSILFYNTRVVNLWLFQFVIGGHDFIDIALLKWQNYKNGRLQFKRYKNRNKPGGGVMVNNVVMPFAKWVIDTYGTKDNERIFSFITNPKNETQYTTYRNNYNRSLKAVSKHLKLTTVITSKSTRYIFRSYGGELLLNDLVIMQLQGHKPKQITFNYQNSLPTAIIDVQHQLITDKAGVTKSLNL